MDEKVLQEQILRLINANYCDFYAMSILDDWVYSFAFNEENKLKVKEKMTYGDFIDKETKVIKEDEVEAYFGALSLTKLDELLNGGVYESKVKYRRLLETGEYRWYQNIITYLPIENSRIIFMMSEDVSNRLTDTEENTLKLEQQVGEYKTALQEERASIGDAILQVNTTLAAQSGSIGMNNTRDYINSVFNKVSVNNPELNKVLSSKIAQTSNTFKKCIVIVDDSSVIRNSLKRIFADSYEIVMAKNGDEAIDLVNKNILSTDFADDRLNIVGILLDLIMPGKDGFAVLDYLKQKRLLDKVPVAIISGDETIETRKKVYEYDIVDMLEKPFNNENIKKRISKIISLYETGNTLQSLVNKQEQQLQDNDSVGNAKYEEVISCIVKNVHNSNISRRITNYTLALTNALRLNLPGLNIDDRFVSAITNTCYLYNIGSIAMDNSKPLTKDFVMEEIRRGLDIIEAVVKDEYEKRVAANIIKFACETNNGRGLPNGVQGVDIPLESAIVSVAVRLAGDTSKQPMSVVASDIIEDENTKYNDNVLKALSVVKDSLE